MNIFVAKLSASTTSEDLKSLFEEYGEVTSAKVIIDKETGNSKRFGFVEMTNDAEGSKAIDTLNECEYDGSQIVVKKAQPQGNSGKGGFNNKRKTFGNNRNNNSSGNSRFNNNRY